MAIQSELVKIEGFKGINNVLKPENTPNEYLKKADNVNIDKRGNILKRKGYSIVDSGAYTSVWSNNSKCYGVKNGDLVEVRNDYSTSVLLANIGNNLSFVEVNGIVYFSSSTVNGAIHNGSVRSWGLDIPNQILALSEVSGILNGGTYQVSYTYVDDNGLESGSGVPSIITVTDNSGIALTVPVSSDARVTSARIYCSNQNGTELFYAGEATPGDSFTIASTNLFNSPLRMFNLSPPPVGELISYYKGRCYIVDDDVIWYSEPSQYEHFNLDSNYLHLPEKVVGLMPVEDGVWIATINGLYFALGTDPARFTLILKENAVMVKGTGSKISSSYLNLGGGYKWLITTNEGVFSLSNQAESSNLTSENVSLERGAKGTSLFLQEEGMNQYLSILEKENKPNNSVMGDIVTTTVVRNGIII